MFLEFKNKIFQSIASKMLYFVTAIELLDRTFMKQKEQQRYCPFSFPPKKREREKKRAVQKVDIVISCKEKIRKENFQMCLSLSFQNLKMFLKSKSLLLFKLN